jgi:hypothetical protein
VVASEVQCRDGRRRVVEVTTRLVQRGFWWRWVGGVVSCKCKIYLRRSTAELQVAEQTLGCTRGWRQKQRKKREYCATSSWFRTKMEKTTEQDFDRAENLNHTALEVRSSPMVGGGEGLGSSWGQSWVWLVSVANQLHRHVYHR